MKILRIYNSNKPNGVEIRALMGVKEFEQLVGNLDNLCVFPTRQLSELATTIKTGARNSYAKYVLVPVTIRRQYRTEDFNFGNTKCGTVLYKDRLYIVYEVPRKS